MHFQSYYKMPAPQTKNENCVAHNGSLVPIPGRDVMIQSWYQGGISLFDWTDVAHPREIAFFDRWPVDSTRMASGGSWSVAVANGVVGVPELPRRPPSRGATPWRALPCLLGPGMLPAVCASAYTVFPRSKFNVVGPIIGLVATLAPTVRPTVGGYITDVMSWHWLFFINVVPGIGITVGVLALVIGGVINIFVGSTTGMLVISVAAIGIFSAYMLYDLKRILDGVETNYISAPLALYLSAIHVFQILLALLGTFCRESD